MSNNIVTFYNGPPADGYIQSIYNRVSKEALPGYTVLQHGSIAELCDQVASLGQMMGSVEVISHGNPYYLGAITCQAVPQLAQALQRSSPIAKFYFSGCNTGTWALGTNQFCISLYLASLVPCQVFGSMGYVNGGTVAEGNIRCSANDWGQENDNVFGGAYDNVGPRVFSQKSRTSLPQFVVPFPPNTPININDPKLTSAQKSVLANVIGLVANRPTQNIVINGQSAPNYSVAAGGDIFDFFGMGDTIRKESNGATCKISLDTNTQSILNSVAMPQPAGTAVVQEPTAAPKVQA